MLGMLTMRCNYINAAKIRPIIVKVIEIFINLDAAVSSAK